MTPTNLASNPMQPLRKGGEGFGLLVHAVPLAATLIHREVGRIEVEPDTQMIVVRPLLRSGAFPQSVA